MAPRCYNCGHIIDVHITADKDPRSPQDGDYSICMYCEVVGIFIIQDGELSVRKPSSQEEMEFKLINLTPDILH